jgi:hypothetical protein
MTILLLILAVGHRTHATVLWAGGEDIDFPAGANICVSTNASAFRAGYAREALTPCQSGDFLISNTFSGGAVTSAWLSARVYPASCCNNGDHFLGLAKSGTNSSLWVGTSNSSSTQVALWKYDGSTWTMLANESGSSLTTYAINKFDMQVLNYGSSSTVNVFVNGSSTARITYTGNSVAGTATSLDEVALSGYANDYVSEVIVSDSDTRALSLVTLAPSAAGDTSQWTGSYSNINPTTINDASVISDANSGDVFQCQMNSLPSGSFSIVGLKIGVRATKSSSGIGSLSIGVKTNSTASNPTAVGLSSSWAEAETYYSTNPVTSTSWTSTDINALQISLQSAP